MSKIQAEIKTLAKRPDGGRIAITTSDVDRDADRVFSQGAQTEKYMRNPVVLFSHLYGQTGPWNVVGRTTKLTMEPNRIVADFELRPAVNEPFFAYFFLLSSPQKW